MISEVFERRRPVRGRWVGKAKSSKNNKGLTVHTRLAPVTHVPARPVTFEYCCDTASTSIPRAVESSRKYVKFEIRPRARLLERLDRRMPSKY